MFVAFIYPKTNFLFFLKRRFFIKKRNKSSLSKFIVNLYKMTHYTIAFYSKAHNEKESLVNRCEKLMIDKINQKRQEVFQCFF